MPGYDDIIDLPYSGSKKHPPMERQLRAAQFAPFAALTGYDASIKEAARLTTQRIELSEEQRTLLDRKLQMLQAHAGEQPTILLTCFFADARKAGGEYRTVEGQLRRIDEYDGFLELTDRTRLPIADILLLECDLLLRESFE